MIAENQFKNGASIKGLVQHGSNLAVDHGSSSVSRQTAFPEVRRAGPEYRKGERELG